MRKNDSAQKEGYESLKKQYLENPKDLNISEQFAGLCFDLEKFKESEKIYQELVKSFPDTSKYNYRLGKVYFSLENYDEALSQQKIAIEKWNGFSWAKLEKIKCLLKLSRSEDAGKSIEELERCIDNKEKDVLLFKNLLKLKIELLENSKLFDEALSTCNKLIELDSNDGFSFYSCGKINLELQKYDAALQSFLSADVLLKQPYVKDKIATALAYLNRKSEAVQVYKQIPSHRMDDYLLQHFGRLYFSIGDLENAKLQLKLAIIKNGKSIAKSHYYLGLVYEKLQLYKNAINEYNIAQEKKKELYKSDYVEALERIKSIKKNIIINENEKIESYIEENIQSTKENLSGIIEKYFDDRGFGFIKDSVNNRYFFHIKNCLFKVAKVGIEVHYVLIDGKKGKEAIKVNIGKK